MDAEGKPQVHLYATNLQVDAHNVDAVMSSPGELRRFNAVDSGDTKQLNSCVAPKVLLLKVGTPVVLLRNVSDTLVNGSLGHVVDFTKRGPVVQFSGTFIRRECVPVDFSVFDKSAGSSIACRTQIPLKAAYALTIHKCQGMTVDSAAIDCHMINRPGQLGVAISRVKSKDGVFLQNFHPSNVVKQPDEVINFYNSIGNIEPLDDLSCCKTLCDDDFLNDVECEIVFPDLENMHEASFINVIPPSFEELQSLDEDLERSLKTETDISLPIDFDLSLFVKNIAYGKSYTNFHATVNGEIERLYVNNRENLIKYISFSYKSVFDMFSAIRESGSVQQRLESAAYSQYHAYVTSPVHVNNTIALFGIDSPCNMMQEQWDVAYRIMTFLRSHVVEEIAKGKTISPPHIRISRCFSDDLGAGVRSKIRYVGGYCFAKIRYNAQCSIRNNLYNVTESNRLQADKNMKKMKLLSHVCRTEAQIYTETSDPESLCEVTRKQNANQGLTHLSDSSFQFSVKLTEKILQMQCSDNLHCHGEDLNEHVLTSVQADEELHSSFVQIFNTPDCLDAGIDNNIKSELLDIIYQEFIGVFSRIFLKQLRKDYLAEVNKTKQAAHRVKVLNNGQQAKSNDFTFNDILIDISSSKIVSHNKLKEVIAIEHSFGRFLKKQLIIICQAYAIPHRVYDKKYELEQKLDREIPNRNGFTHPDVFNECPVEVRKSLKRTRKCDNKCPECQQEGVEGELWIQCDRCRKWFHRDCAEIFDDAEWRSYVDNGEDFICFRC